MYVVQTQEQWFFQTAPENFSRTKQLSSVARPSPVAPVERIFVTLVFTECLSATQHLVGGETERCVVQSQEQWFFQMAPEKHDRCNCSAKTRGE